MEHQPSLLTVIGARPQFIKAAVLSRALARQGRLREVLVHTGQHYDENMSARFFSELGIPTPSYNLKVGSGSPGAQVGLMLERARARAGRSGAGYDSCVRRYELHAGRRPDRRLPSRAGRPRGGRPPQPQLAHARGDQPRHNGSALHAPLLPQRRGRAEPRTGGHRAERARGG